MAQVNASSSMVDAAVMGLKLDELELASLRGEVQEVSLNLNFDTRMGRGKVNVAGPRFSGLQGEALSGGVRWERDVIRLEKAVLQQRSSRWAFLAFMSVLIHLLQTVRDLSTCGACTFCATNCSLLGSLVYYQASHYIDAETCSFVFSFCL